MGISGNMQSLSQLCACYGVPRVTQGFTTLFIGETFAVYHISRFTNKCIFSEHAATKTFWKIESPNAISWIHLGGTAKKKFFLGIKLFCFSK